MVATTLLVVHGLLVITFSVRVLWRDDLSPSARLAWFVILTTLPYVGVITFLLFGETSLGRTIHQRHAVVFKQIHAEAEKFVGSCDDHLDGNVEVEYRAAFRAASIDGLETTGGNRGELMPDAKQARSRLIEDMNNATDHINVLYYIWLDDQTGTDVANALIRAVARGVTCRAMADGLGSRIFVKSTLWRKMTEAGVDTQVALPIRGFLRTIFFSRIDLRNHRKITIIDGRITYCGSQNCADPEFRVKPKYAPWIDIMIRFEGPVVAQNQLLFASDWMLHRPDASLTDFPLHDERHNNGFVAQVFGDGPTETNGATPQLFATLMALAQSEVTISTPYFVPDQVVLNALLATARRGIKVSLILPKKNDSWIVAAVSHSYYRRLLKAGIRIFEFEGGLLHAKTLTIDRVVTMIGSTNLDLRSFDLNYENDILFRDNALTEAVLARQQDYIARSTAIALNDVLAWAPTRRIWNNVVATVGPVL